MTASGSLYRNGSFPSDTSWDDFIKWCLAAMQNKFDREAKEKGLCKPSATAEAPATSTVATTTETAAAGTTTTEAAAAAAAAASVVATGIAPRNGGGASRSSLSPSVDASFLKLGWFPCMGPLGAHPR